MNFIEMKLIESQDMDYNAKLPNMSLIAHSQDVNIKQDSEVFTNDIVGLNNKLI
jgi:hypothetical protein